MKRDLFLGKTILRIPYALTIKILEFMYWDYAHEYCVTELLMNLIFNCKYKEDLFIHVFFCIIKHFNGKLYNHKKSY